MPEQKETLTDRLLGLLLHSADSPLSGEAMSTQLGVTRAAVWKSITQLREQGFSIESGTNRGYRLAEIPNRLSVPLIAAAMRQPQPDRLVVLDSVDSTILAANRMILEGCPNGTVVLADRQTAGMGRMGRSFLSEPEVGVYLALVVAPNCPVQQLGLLTSYAGLAVCGAIEALAPVQAAIKWPNDILLGSRKVCGILTRLVSDAETNTITHAIVGIGINVLQQQFPAELADKAVSILQAGGGTVSRAQLAAGVIDRLDEMLFEQNWLQRPPPAALQELRRRSCTVGQPVRVVTPTTERIGVAEGIDQNGELLVRFGDRLESVTAGEVSVHGLLGYSPAKEAT